MRDIIKNGNLIYLHLVMFMFYVYRVIHNTFVKSVDLSDGKDCIMRPTDGNKISKKFLHTSYVLYVFALCDTAGVKPITHSAAACHDQFLRWQLWEIL